MTAPYGMRLHANHAEMLQASGITADHARARGYVSVTEKVRLENLKIAKAGRSVPGLLVPERGVDGSVWGYQYRPDMPRRKADGKVIKYETPYQQRNGIDVPPGVGPKLGDPTIPLFITEGVKKADSAVGQGLTCVAIPGVWSWLGKNPEGGKVAIPDWRDIALNGRRVILAFDSDVVAKKAVRAALTHLAGYLEIKDAKVEYLHLPNDDDGKTGLDDYLAGHTVEELWTLVKPDRPVVIDAAPKPHPRPEPKPELPPVRTLEELLDTFRKWLGDGYDSEAMTAVLAAAAVERLDGDPLWLFLISGSGNAKTEMVQPLTGAGGIMTSTIPSEGALLSGTSQKERTDDATGGLLRKIGRRGVLVIKDVTSILTNSGDQRGKVLSALREIHDGRWDRPVGVDGGRTLQWRGRIAVVGAVTTQWDRAHDAVAAMGDRFVLIRTDSNAKATRIKAGRKAIANTGSEIKMRAELAQAVGGVIAGMSTDVPRSAGDEAERLLQAADIVTRARTAVDFDYKGNVVDAHAPEMPTRFAKQLGQMVRGAVAIGVDRTDALRLAIRCARDSIPPLRRIIIDDLAKNPESTASDVRKRTGKPWTTIDRQLQALHMLEVLDCNEVAYGEKEEKHRWLYSLANGINPAALDPDAIPAALDPDAILETSPDFAHPSYKDGSDSPADDATSHISYVGFAESGEVLSDAQRGSHWDADDSTLALFTECKHCQAPLTWPDSQQRGTCAQCWVGSA